MVLRCRLDVNGLIPSWFILVHYNPCFIQSQNLKYKCIKNGSQVTLSIQQLWDVLKFGLYYLSDDCETSSCWYCIICLVAVKCSSFEIRHISVPVTSSVWWLWDVLLLWLCNLLICNPFRLHFLFVGSKAPSHLGDICLTTVGHPPVWLTPSVIPL